MAKKGTATMFIRVLAHNPKCVELVYGSCSQGWGADGKLHWIPFPYGPDGGAYAAKLFYGEAAEQTLSLCARRGIPIVDN